VTIDRHDTGRLRPQRAGATPYKVAGAAHRAAVARAAAALAKRQEDDGISGFDLMTLHAVLSLTTSWSKLCDRTSARQLGAIIYGVAPEELTGGQRRRVRDSAQRLATAGVIDVEGALGGPTAGLVVNVPEDPNVPSSEHVAGRQRVLAGAPTCSGGSAQRVPAGGQHLGNREEPQHAKPRPIERCEQCSQLTIDCACGAPSVRRPEALRSIA